MVCDTTKFGLTLILSKYRDSIADINSDIETFYTEKRLDKIN